MKRVFSLSVAFVLAASAPQKISLATGLQRSYAGIKMNLTEMSTKMSDADYLFQPTKDVRTFAYCDAAYAALTDASAVEFVKQGQNEVARRRART